MRAHRAPAAAPAAPVRGRTRTSARAVVRRNRTTSISTHRGARAVVLRNRRGIHRQTCQDNLLPDLSSEAIVIRHYKGCRVNSWRSIGVRHESARAGLAVAKIPAIKRHRAIDIR